MLTKDIFTARRQRKREREREKLIVHAIVYFILFLTTGMAIKNLNRFLLNRAISRPMMDLYVCGKGSPNMQVGAKSAAIDSPLY